ncbi:NfeD family protein [Sulfuriroseicoccus oceanibius]|uniref:Uncharacterized protein n=1 Tax=Sulfuriroseicoccus oceanibius TaxID=2707525 RepID=A0A6B3L5L5_9BACT|nr:NfeD family protein [Sulfuriroseicoccus oceanibius]QQL44200.1 hypothetical protein G3M56_009870 [Sulfuriroseicoccus oceanibius]
MSEFLRSWVMRWLACWVVLWGGAITAAADDGGVESVAVVNVGNDEVSRAADWRRVADVLQALQDAGEEQVVLQIRTTTGFDQRVAEQMVRKLPALEMRTVGWVDGTALSGGAIAALLCDELVVSPSAVIGDVFDPSSVAGRAPDDSGEAADKERAKDVRDAKRVARLLAAQLVAVTREHAWARPLVNGWFGDQAAAREKLGLEPAASGEEDAPLVLMADEAVAVGLAVRSADSLDDVAEGETQQLRTVREVERWAAEKKQRVDAAKEKQFAEDKQSADSASGDVQVAESDEQKSGPAVPFGNVDEVSYTDKIVVIEVGQDSLVNQANFEFMERALLKADKDGAKAIVFDMDTPGGLVWQTSELMLKTLINLKTPTFTYVNTRAISAGSLVAVATDAIYMAPGATIGSAGVVQGGGQDLAETMEQKVVSMVISTARNAAIQNGHNPDVVEAFIDKDKEVVIDGEVISKAGEMLNLNTPEATRKINGRPVLAKGEVNSIEELLAAEGIEYAPEDLIKAEQMGFEKFAFWVVKLAPLLIMLGVIGAYTEMKTPGLGIPGLVAICAFGIYFFGAHLAGKLAGFELVALFVLGMVLILLEIFVIPTTFIFGLIGAVMVFASLALGLVDKAPVIAPDGGDIQWGELLGDVLIDPLLMVSLGFAGAMAVILVLMRYLPSVPLFHRFILEKSVPVGTSSALGNEPADQTSQGAKSYVGRRGVADSVLRPSGRAMIDGEVVDVVSDGEFINQGAAVEVVAQEGLRVVVKEVEPDA